MQFREIFVTDTLWRLSYDLLCSDIEDPTTLYIGILGQFNVPLSLSLNSWYYKRYFASMTGKCYFYFLLTGCVRLRGEFLEERVQYPHCVHAVPVHFCSHRSSVVQGKILLLYRRVQRDEKRVPVCNIFLMNLKWYIIHYWFNLVWI